MQVNIIQLAFCQNVTVYVPNIFVQDCRSIQSFEHTEQFLLKGNVGPCKHHREGEGGKKPLIAPHRMLLLPATPMNKLYKTKHEDSQHMRKYNKNHRQQFTAVAPNC